MPDNSSQKYRFLIITQIIPDALLELQLMRVDKLEYRPGTRPAIILTSNVIKEFLSAAAILLALSVQWGAIKCGKR